MNNTIIKEHPNQEKELDQKMSKQIWLKELEKSAFKDICYHFPLLQESEEKEDLHGKDYHQRGLFKAFWILKNIYEEVQEQGEKNE